MGSANKHFELFLAAMSSLSGGDAAVATLVGGMALLVYASTRHAGTRWRHGRAHGHELPKGSGSPAGYPLLTMLGSRCVSPKRVLFALPGRPPARVILSVLQLAARVPGCLWAAVCTALAARGNHGPPARPPSWHCRYRLLVFAMGVFAPHSGLRAVARVWL